MEISRCILEDSGMEVTCAVDGQEAVEIFEDCCLKKCMADNSDVKLHEDL